MNDNILLIEIIAADIVTWLLQRDARKRKQIKG